MNNDMLGSSTLVNDALDAPFELGPEVHGVAFAVVVIAVEEARRESIVAGEGCLSGVVIIPQRLGSDRDGAILL